MKTNNLINLFRLYWLENKKNIFLFVGITFLLIWGVLVVLFGSGIINGHMLGIAIYYDVLNVLVDFMFLWAIIFMGIQSEKTILKPIKQDYMMLSVSSVQKTLFYFFITSVFLYIIVFFAYLLSINLFKNISHTFFSVQIVGFNFEEITFISLSKSIVKFFLIQSIIVTLLIVLKKKIPLKYISILFVFFTFILFIVTIGTFYRYKLPFNESFFAYISLIVLFWIANYFLLKKRQLK